MLDSSNLQSPLLNFFYVHNIADICIVYIIVSKFIPSTKFKWEPKKCFCCLGSIFDLYDDRMCGWVSGDDREKQIMITQKKGWSAKNKSSRVQFPGELQKKKRKKKWRNKWRNIFFCFFLHFFFQKFSKNCQVRKLWGHFSLHYMITQLQFHINVIAKGPSYTFPINTKKKKRRFIERGALLVLFLIVTLCSTLTDISLLQLMVSIT